MDQQEANKQIAEKIAQAQKLVDECVAIAELAGVDFYIDFGGYGTGATYYPEKLKGEGDEDDWYPSSSGWLSSSQSC